MHSDSGLSSPKQIEAMQTLAENIRQWGQQLGFQQVGITDTHLQQHAAHFQQWLSKGLHGEMHYMAEREQLRLNPALLHPSTLRVISLRMDYFLPETQPLRILEQSDKAFISRYALGRDYHKLIRKRLATLGNKISAFAEQYIDMDSSQRPFVDSAPVLERAFAEKSQLGWIGKNTLLINKKAGSWFFLGELLTNLPLPIDPDQTSKHCGSCTACLDICPTKAFNGPFELDARKCISYLTIELKGEIPIEYRKAIGNRVFGCDDCQLVCPWNKFAQPSSEADFKPRHQLDNSELLTLFLWSEEEFERNTQGSAIRRIGYQRWLRNLAVALGNGPKTSAVINALKQKQGLSALLDTHISWALNELTTNP